MNKLRRIFTLIVLGGLSQILMAQTDSELNAWNDVNVYEINKLYPRVNVMPTDGDWCQLLNGDWKFNWVATPSEAPTDFFKTDFDASSWGTIPVPSN